MKRISLKLRIQGGACVTNYQEVAKQRRGKGMRTFDSF